MNSSNWCSSRRNPGATSKPLAKALMTHFGSFAEVISVGAQALTEVEGIGQAAVVALKTVRAAALRLLRDEAMDRSVLNS